MIRGLYTAASGMLANEQLQEMITNNLANADTPGFKAQDGELLSFPEQLMERIQYSNGESLGTSTIPTGTAIGKMGTGVWLQESLSRFTEGNLQKSDKPYDYAIVDQPNAQTPGFTSFFATYDPNASPQLGPILTRDGHFIKDANNLLATPTGQRLLAIDQSTGKPILDSAIQIQPDGTTQAVVVDANGVPTNGSFVDANGKSIPVVNTVSAIGVPDPNQLQPYGDNGYITTASAKFQISPAEIRHGYIEGSNVNPTQSMVSMVNVMRSYEANSKVIHTIDQSMDLAVTQIGKVG